MGKMLSVPSGQSAYFKDFFSKYPAAGGLMPGGTNMYVSSKYPTLLSQFKQMGAKTSSGGTAKYARHANILTSTAARALTLAKAQSDYAAGAAAMQGMSISQLQALAPKTKGGSLWQKIKDRFPQSTQPYNPKNTKMGIAGAGLFSRIPPGVASSGAVKLLDKLKNYIPPGALQKIGYLAGGLLGICALKRGFGVDAAPATAGAAMGGYKVGGAAAAAIGAGAAAYALSDKPKIHGGNKMGFYTKLDQALGGYLPGGMTPSQQDIYAMHGGVAYSWNTGTATFSRLADGRIAVQKKNGLVKIYRPYKPLVFGKKTDAKKFIRVAKKHKKIYSELRKIFKTTKRC